MTSMEEIITHCQWLITDRKWALKTTIISMGIEMLLEEGPLKASTYSDNYNPPSKLLEK